jgi:hypothetical protein
MAPRRPGAIKPGAVKLRPKALAPRTRDDQIAPWSVILGWPFKRFAPISVNAAAEEHTAAREAGGLYLRFFSQIKAGAFAPTGLRTKINPGLGA